MAYPGLPITWLLNDATDYDIATIIDIHQEQNP